MMCIQDAYKMYARCIQHYFTLYEVICSANQPLIIYREVIFAPYGYTIGIHWYIQLLNRCLTAQTPEK